MYSQRSARSAYVHHNHGGDFHHDRHIIWRNTDKSHEQIMSKSFYVPGRQINGPAPGPPRAQEPPPAAAAAAAAAAVPDCCENSRSFFASNTAAFAFSAEADRRSPRRKHRAAKARAGGSSSPRAGSAARGAGIERGGRPRAAVFDPRELAGRDRPAGVARIASTESSAAPTPALTRGASGP